MLNSTYKIKEKIVENVKHLKALVIKAIVIWAILWIILTGLYDISFMDSTIVGVIIVVMFYI